MNKLFIKAIVSPPVYFISACFICLAIVVLPAVQILGMELNHMANESQIPVFSGKVTDSEGQPLPSISVQRKGVIGGTFTDADGMYKIRAKKGEVLVFSRVGYMSQEIRLGDSRTVNVQMSVSMESLEEVVVVGYGTQKRSDVTNAIATVDVEDIENAPQSSVVDMLAGRVAGLTVIEGSGMPGGDDEGSEVTIRGTGTLNDAAPLVVIDGVQSTLEDLSVLGVHEIASISVLKDASSTAIYGARGANGVILVTTKAPVEGNFRFTLNSWAGVQDATVKPKFVNAWQWMTLHNEASAGTLFPDWAIENVKNGIYTDQFSDYNPVPDVFHKALHHSHSLSVSGGTKVIKFTGSLGFQDQGGIIVNNTSNRVNYRSSMAVHISPKVRLGFTVSGSKQGKHGGVGGVRMVMNRLYRTYPITPLHYANGDWGVYNPYTEVTILPARLMAEIGRTDEYFIQDNFAPSLELKPIKNLLLRSQVSIRNNTREMETFNPTYAFHAPNGDVAAGAAYKNTNTLTIREVRNRQVQVSQTANYNYSPNRQNRFTFLLGYEFVQNNIDRRITSGSGFPNNEQQVLDRATSNISARGLLNVVRLQSFFGRVNYAFKNRYFFESNVRADGSSRFPPTKQYAILPSVSAGWMLSREKFFSNWGLNDFVQELKFRGGWGKVANDKMERTQTRVDPTGNYVHQQTLDLENYYYFGGEVVPGAAITAFANENISWEETATTGAGLDMMLFKKRIELTVDWYDRLTDGILYRVPLPPSFGTPRPAVQNVAKVSNRGWEFTALYRHSPKRSAVNFHIGGNLSLNKNKILSLNGEETISDPFILREGEEFNSFFGYVVDGIAKTEEDKQYTFNGNGGIGHLMFKDINHDGLIDEKDRAVLGSSNIPWTYGIRGGFNYKGLSFNFLLQGVQDKVIYIRDWGNRPGDAVALNFWREWWDNRYHAVDNPEGTWPKMDRGGARSGANLTSTFWIHDASYLRLRNVELGYSFPTALVNRYKLSKFRVFFSGKNLLTFTDLIDQIDPERRSNEAANTAFPQTKVVTVGVNVGF